MTKSLACNYWVLQPVKLLPGGLLLRPHATRSRRQLSFRQRRLQRPINASERSPRSISAPRAARPVRGGKCNHIS